MEKFLPEKSIVYKYITEDRDDNVSCLLTKHHFLNATEIASNLGINNRSIIKTLFDSKTEIEKQKKEQEKIEEKLKWCYPYMQSSEIPTKTSVTKLKQMQEEKIKISNQKQIQLTAVPKFMEKQQKLTPTQKGTLMHLCIQKCRKWLLRTH